MSCASRQIRLSLAILAWLAQMLLPTTQAWAMAAVPAGSGFWCGVPPSALRAQLVRLPSDVRNLLEKSAAQSSQIKGCAHCCVSLGGHGAPVAARHDAFLRSGEIEVPAASSFPSPQRIFSASPPPARGPPTLF